MSKIQQGIRSAKKAWKQKEGTVSPMSDAKADSGARRKRKLPQSVLDLKPGHRAALDTDHLERNRIIHDDYPLDALTPYKMLRTRVLQEMDRNDWRTLAVTAAHEGAGKTITAINLAITIAQGAAQSVYLLDLDLRKPGVARCMGIADVHAGLGEYLSKRLDVGDILWDVGIDHLVVVPGTTRFGNSSELLTSPPMNDLIAGIRSDPAKPIVILDLPPVLMTDDALAIAPMIDSLLFVVAEGETKRADVTHSIELLKDISLVGAVLNKSRNRQRGY